MSGNMAANGFGRSGFWVWMLAALSACIATVLGAVIGGALLAFVAGDDPGRGVFLAVIANVYSAEIYWLFMTWLVSTIGVDSFARWGPFAPRFQKLS